MCCRKARQACELSQHEGLSAQQSELEALIRRIVNARVVRADVAAMEAEANVRVYRLFGLTPEEIAIVETLLLPARITGRFRIDALQQVGNRGRIFFSARGRPPTGRRI